MLCYRHDGQKEGNMNNWIKRILAISFILWFGWSLVSRF